MKQAIYQQFEDLITNNPISGFYEQLEDIVNTAPPILGGHKKAVEEIYHRLEELRVGIETLISTKNEEENIFDYRGEIGIRENSARLALMLYQDAEKAVEGFRTEIKPKNPKYTEDQNNPQDYLFFAQPLLSAVAEGKQDLEKIADDLKQKEELTGLYLKNAMQIGKLINYLGIDLKQVVHEFQMEKRTELHHDCSQNLKQLLQSHAGQMKTIAKNLNQNIRDITTYCPASFPENLDYKMVLPSVLRTLRKEYAAYRENPEVYQEARDREISDKINKVLTNPLKS